MNKELNTQWVPLRRSDYKHCQVKRFYEITLGKMLQPTARDSRDKQVPYLKSLNVKWDKIRLDPISTMWANAREIKELELHTGDLLVCEGGEVGRSSILSTKLPLNCIIQNAVHRVRPRPNANNSYLRYLLIHASSQGWFNVLCNKATIAHFTVEKFNELWISIPNKLTQEKIASFLDRETVRIDDLIAEKEHMLKLLKEKRAVVISQAVTQGLNPSAPVKNSGIEWLGMIPEHWSSHRCGVLFIEKDIRNEPELPLLYVSLNTGVTLRVFNASKIESMASDLGTMKVARKDTLVFNKMRFWQGAAGIAPTDGLVSPDYTVAEISNLLLPEFVEYMFRTKLFSLEVKRYSYGMVDDRLRLYWDEFKNIRIPVPPLSEQTELIKKIKGLTYKNETIEKELKDSIKLLNERRSALITAAVTGQINI